MLVMMTEDEKREVISGILDCFEELLDKLEITYLALMQTRKKNERWMITMRGSTEWSTGHCMNR